jgi:hypothetical protein
MTWLASYDVAGIICISLFGGVLGGSSKKRKAGGAGGSGESEGEGVGLTGGTGAVEAGAYTRSLFSST